MCGATAVSSRAGSAAHRLACNDVCKIAERNRRLALAFDLKDRAEAPLAGLIKATYSDDLLRFARANLALVRDVETRAAAFVADRARCALAFAPMKHTSRAFLHALAPFYGCRSRSMDSEPQRSACWDRGPHATVPSILLSNAIRYAHAPPVICSDRVAEEEEDFDETGSHAFAGASWATNAAADRLRKKLDHIVIQNLRHALTADELRVELDRLLPGAPYAISWTGEDEVEMRCTDAGAKYECLVKWEAMLKAKLPRLGVAGLVKGVASPPPSAAPTPVAAREPAPPAVHADDSGDDDSASAAGSDSDSGTPDDWE
ncbi:FKBP12-associated protein [Coemansia nantahalensis]|uniref:FKBP12-associated protein n=1 Tax=Coemansia nantahalensis TaxID=2789366 RepID=A0ACC1K699_9FUNG|nr:FKBP12-associated protein [Coemansia nantahalensis]